MNEYVSQRLRYFKGQFLEEPDFTDEQAYHLNRRRLHNQHLHTPGIIEGLEVLKKDINKIKVKPGLALDSFGRELYLDKECAISVPENAQASSSCCVWIEYSEIKTEPQDPNTEGTQTRFKETVTVNVSVEPIEIGKIHVKLAQFKLTSEGNIPGDPNDDLDGNGEPQRARIYTGDRSVSVGKLKTELVAEEKNVLLKGIIKVEAYRSPYNNIGSTSSNRSAHLLVFAYVENEPQTKEDADKYLFSWEITHGCIIGDDQKKYRTQTVEFKNKTSGDFSISFSIYALLE